MNTLNKNIIAEKIKIALVKNNDMKITELSDMLSTSPSNVSNKLKRNNFCETDLHQICDALGYDVEITLISRKTGEKI